MKSAASPAPPLFATPAASDFSAAVAKRTTADFNLCYHCRSCAGGCPFIDAMDHAPHALIRMVQFGFKEAALACRTIWICVGCHTCSVQCPMGIDIAAIMDALRQMALEEGRPVAEPDILNFHREVLASIQRYGRAHKLEIMLRLKIRKKDWLADLDVGLKMLQRRKLDLRPSKVRDKRAIQRMFRPGARHF